MQLTYVFQSFLVIVVCFSETCCFAQNSWPAIPAISYAGPAAAGSVPSSFAAPGLSYSNSQAARLQPASIITRTDFLAYKNKERSPCEEVRSQRRATRIVCISGAVIGTVLIGIGLKEAFDHLLSNNGDGADETGLGLICLVGSSVGYAIAIPHLNKKYRVACKE